MQLNHVFLAEEWVKNVKKTIVGARIKQTNEGGWLFFTSTFIFLEPFRTHWGMGINCQQALSCRTGLSLVCFALCRESMQFFTAEVLWRKPWEVQTRFWESYQGCKTRKPSSEDQFEEETHLREQGANKLSGAIFGIYSELQIQFCYKKESQDALDWLLPKCMHAPVFIM